MGQLKDGDILPGTRVRIYKAPAELEIGTVYTIYIRKDGTFGYGIDVPSFPHRITCSIEHLEIVTCECRECNEGKNRKKE